MMAVDFIPDHEDDDENENGGYDDSSDDDDHGATQEVASERMALAVFRLRDE